MIVFVKKLIRIENSSQIDEFIDIKIINFQFTN